MAAVTDEIGTIGRDFSTVVLFESSWGDHAGDDLTGEMFNDSVFDEVVVMNDATPDSVTLTVPVSERHDGTAGTGVRIVRTGNGAVITGSAELTLDIGWMEVDVGSNESQGAIILDSNNNIGIVRNVIVHDIGGGANSWGIVISDGSFEEKSALNCIVYNVITNSSASHASAGIRCDTNSPTKIRNVINCTVHNTQNNNGTGTCHGIEFFDEAALTLQNCIVTDSIGTTSSTPVDYSVSSPSNATVDHNLSSDGTASGAGSLTWKLAVDQFVSIVSGLEDLHKKLGSTAIDAGVDKGTSPPGVETSIDGFNRDTDTSRDPWDMGADEFLFVKEVGMPQHIDVSVTVTAVKLGDNRVDQIQLQADAANDDDILWGDKDLQNMTLAPNGSQALPAKNLDEVFVKSASGTQSLHVAFASL